MGLWYPLSQVMTDEKSVCWLGQRPIRPVFLHKVQNAIHSSIAGVDSGICSAQASGLTASKEAKLLPSSSFSYFAFFQIDTPIPWSLFFLLRTPANWGLPTYLAPANLVLLLKTSSLHKSPTVCLTLGCVLVRICGFQNCWLCGEEMGNYCCSYQQ